MKKNILLAVIFLVVVLALIYVFNRPEDNEKEVVVVGSYEECVAAGYPVMESYPPRCQTPEGQVFTQDIGNELEKSDLIRLETPRPNTVVGSPLTIRGEARGYWFFEASFPARLLDGNGKELALIPVQATGEWMTTEFVNFSAVINFPQPTTATGTLILEKDNPSGLPENADQLIVPVRFVD